MYKNFGLILCLLAAIGLFGCGNAKDEGGDHHESGGPASNLHLEWNCPDLPSEHLYCSSLSLNWPAPGEGLQFDTLGQVRQNNRQQGEYSCNIQQIDDSWVVTNVDIATDTCRVNGYALGWKDVRDNNTGGGNWVFVLNADGTISQAPGNPPGTVSACLPENHQAHVSLDIELKSYDYVPFVPQVAFSADSFNRHAMTALAANRWHLVYDSVPTNDYYTLNFWDPVNHAYLFGPAGSSGNYVVYVNGTQVYQIKGDDMYFQIDACGEIQVPRSNLAFVFTPDKTISNVQLYFGQDQFAVSPLTASGGDWVGTIPNVPIGRYEANISYLATTYEMAVLTDLIHGTIAINGIVITSIVVYAHEVPNPDPTGPALIVINANLFFDVLSKGVVKEANGATTPVIIEIPVP